MNWKRNILTDSGGFQMVSLSKYCEINEKEVVFEHPTTKEKMHLRPEDSIKAQNDIGSDIMMALDDVIKTTTSGPRVEEACHRTVRWIDRCLDANRNPEKYFMFNLFGDLRLGVFILLKIIFRQNLFPIVQGGLDLRLRDICLNELTKRNANGFAIGGLSGGESKLDFVKVNKLTKTKYQVVSYCTKKLPENKPRYLMGVGFPEDLVICVSLGVDMFDCVFPSRTARFGNALTDYGPLKLTSAKYKFDFNPFDAECDFEVRIFINFFFFF